MSTNGQPATPPTIVRKKHGTGHVYDVNGRRSIGVTTALNAGFPKPAIARWSAKAAAETVLFEWDSLAAMDPRDRFERVRTAPDRDRDEAARRGQDVHALAHRLQAEPDVDVPVPDALEGLLDAYLAFVDDWQPVELYVEAPIANLTWGYSGTPDIVADLVDGDRWLLDFKTGRSGVYPEAALQLAAYRFAEWILGPDGVAVPMPAVDRVGAIWLKADRTYELVELDASEATFKVFLYVLKVAAFTRREFDDVMTKLEAPARA